MSGVQYLSFTGTWLAFARDRLTTDDLRAEDAVFHFGCDRSYLFSERIPMEATWAMGDADGEWAGKGWIFDPSQVVSIHDLDERCKNKWQQFFICLMMADREDRIRWNICRSDGYSNYYEYADALKAQGYDIHPPKYVS